VSNKKITLVLSSITTVLVVAVFVLGYFKTQNDSTGADFLRIQKDSLEEAEQNNNENSARNSSVTEKQTEEFFEISLEEIKTAEDKKITVKTEPNGTNTELESAELNAEPESTKTNIDLVEEVTSESKQDVKLVTETEEIPFETLEFFVDWLSPGESEKTINGVNGAVEIVYQVIYQDGKPIKKIEKTREIVKNPIREEIAIGAEKKVAKATTSETPAPTANASNNPTESSNQASTTTSNNQANNTFSPTTTSAPEPTETPTVKASSGVNFVTPGPTSAAFTNLDLIRGYLKPNGLATYSSFSVNNNQTITVDGVTFPYDSSYTSTFVTGYDGALLNSFVTASGLPTQRGIVASTFIEYGGLPFGTVLFVEGYGLVVVGDRNGMGSTDTTALDICFNDSELVDGSISPGRSSRQVFVLSTN